MLNRSFRSSSQLIAKLGLALAIAFTATSHVAAATPIKLGIDALEEQGFALVSGKKIGLLTHPAGVNRYGIPTVEILKRARGVTLAALFGPEHGIYGDEKAGVHVEDRRDPRTGLPIYSLYGKHRKPTQEMLYGLDALVIDLQDIGSRSYTYVSCMKLALEACFENDVEVIILDRPNPLGGLKVDGPLIEAKWKSYVGAFSVPYVHGLTMGELARMALYEDGGLDLTEAQRRSGKLSIVTMDGWNRYMSWPATGLKWTPTSPNIPTFEAAVGYAMTGLGAQLGDFQHGIGTPYPFRFLTFGETPPDELQKALEGQRVPGIALERKSIAQSGKEGVYVKVSDWRAWRPTQISFHMMLIAAAKSDRQPFAEASQADMALFNKFSGSTSWWREISAKGSSANLAGYLALWERQARQFQLQSRRYWLYE